MKIGLENLLKFFEDFVERSGATVDFRADYFHDAMSLYEPKTGYKLDEPKEGSRHHSARAESRLGTG
jgi:hypothetical protein